MFTYVTIKNKSMIENGIAVYSVECKRRDISLPKVDIFSSGIVAF